MHEMKIFFYQDTFKTFFAPDRVGTDLTSYPSSILIKFVVETSRSIWHTQVKLSTVNQHPEKCVRNSNSLLLAFQCKLKYCLRFLRNRNHWPFYNYLCASRLTFDADRWSLIADRWSLINFMRKRWCIKIGQNAVAIVVYFYSRAPGI